jgi:uncharacterized protein with PIN domain/prolyl-tRNA editing enzyme YbaK/EbsC (Cys-tRNA(Pro) deacylase)
MSSYPPLAPPPPGAEQEEEDEKSKKKKKKKARPARPRQQHTAVDTLTPFLDAAAGPAGFADQLCALVAEHGYGPASAAAGTVLQVATSDPALFVVECIRALYGRDEGAIPAAAAAVAVMLLQLPLTRQSPSEAAKACAAELALATVCGGSIAVEPTVLYRLARSFNITKATIPSADIVAYTDCLFGFDGAGQVSGLAAAHGGNIVEDTEGVGAAPLDASLLSNSSLLADTSLLSVSMRTAEGGEEGEEGESEETEDDAEEAGRGAQRRTRGREGGERPDEEGEGEEEGGEEGSARMGTGKQGRTHRKKTATVAVRLLAHFKPALPDPRAIFLRLAALDHWPLAAEFADMLKMEEMQSFLVELCYKYSLFRTAYRLVKRFHLQAAFPDAELLFRGQKMGKLLRKGYVEMAAAECAPFPELRIKLVNCLMHEGQVALALEYRDRFELQQMIPIEQATLDRQLSHFRSTYLQLPFPLANVLFVDSESRLAEAARILLAPPEDPDLVHVVGLDAEWRPTSEGGKDSPVSILQLSTRTHAVILDIMNLASSAYSDLLTALFTSRSIFKVGFSFSGDLKKLRASQPNATCFTSIESLLELQDIANAASPSWGRSLSDLCHTVLGLSLSKVDRMSNWELRPLTERQVGYAALDAWCECAIVDSIIKSSLAAQEHRYLRHQQDHRQHHAAQGRPADLLAEQLDTLSLSSDAIPHEESGASAALKRVSLGEATAFLARFTRSISFSRTNMELLQVAPSDAAAPDAAQPAHDLLPPPLLAEYAHVRKLAEAELSFPEEDVLTDVHVARTLEALGLDPATVFTSAAEESATSLEAMGAKSLCFFVSGRPIVVLIGAGLKVAPLALARHFDVPKREIVFASPSECVAIFGYVPGTMPPLAHRAVFHTVMDRGLARERSVLCGSGSTERLLKLHTGLLAHITGAEIIDMARSRGATAAQQAQQEAEGVVASEFAGRFVADDMLGRLVRWLRCAGLDVLHAEQGSFESIVRLALAEKRTILTCSRKNAERDSKGVPCYFVTGKDLKAQLVEVVSHFNINLHPDTFMARCTKCNGIFQSLDADEAERRVALRKGHTIREFWECNSCGLVVWRGQQVRRMWWFLCVSMHSFSPQFPQYRSVMRLFCDIYGSVPLSPEELERFEKSLEEEERRAAQCGEIEAPTGLLDAAL